MTVTGIAAGVPYVALPPSNVDGPAPLVVVWHLLDTPNTEDAMAAAVPMADVPAWRVYFGLPMTGRRALPGGMDELVDRATADYVLNLVKPVVEQAASEFPAALAGLRAQLSVADSPVGVAGGSLGGLVTYEVVARAEVPIAAAAMVNPVTQLAPVVAMVENQRRFTYRWSPESHAAVEHFDFVRRAGELKAPTLLVLGAEDDAAFREPAALTGLDLVTIPGMGHAITDEQVDAEFTQWFQRHL